MQEPDNTFIDTGRLMEDIYRQYTLFYNCYLRLDIEVPFKWTSIKKCYFLNGAATDNSFLNNNLDTSPVK